MAIDHMRLATPRRRPLLAHAIALVSLQAEDQADRTGMLQRLHCRSGVGQRAPLASAFGAGGQPRKLDVQTQRQRMQKIFLIARRRVHLPTFCRSLSDNSAMLVGMLEPIAQGVAFTPLEVNNPLA